MRLIIRIRYRVTYLMKKLIKQPDQFVTIIQIMKFKYLLRLIIIFAIKFKGTVSKKLNNILSLVPFSSKHTHFKQIRNKYFC